MLFKKHPWAYFVLGLIGVQIILPVSSSNISHNEDEIGAERLFPDAEPLEDLP